MSWKWHFRDPNFKQFSVRACPPDPKAHTFKISDYASAFVCCTEVSCLEADGYFQPQILKRCFATKDHSFQLIKQFICCCYLFVLVFSVSHKKAKMFEMSVVSIPLPLPPTGKGVETLFKQLRTVFFPRRDNPLAGSTPVLRQSRQASLSTNCRRNRNFG